MDKYAQKSKYNLIKCYPPLKYMNRHNLFYENNFFTKSANNGLKFQNK